LLKPAAEVEDRQGGLTCPWKFMCILPRRCEEETGEGGFASGAHGAEAKLKGTSKVVPALEILCRAVTLQAAALRGLVVLKWALRTLSYGGDCCSLDMAYTWLSTSYACPASCAMLLCSTTEFAGD